MTRVFHHTLRLTHLILWLALVSLAFTLSALRFWLLPRIDQFRHQLENRLSQHIAQPIQIRHLKASLDGITPQLRLIGVTVGPNGSHQPRFEEIQLGIDLPASLRSGRLQPAWVKILGAHIAVSRTANGRFQVLGLGNGGAESLPRWLMADGRFELLHSTLIWHSGSDSRAVTWHNVYVCLDNHGAEHRLQVRFEAPEVLAAHASLNARLQGEIDHPEQWQADFLLHLKQFQLTGAAETFLLQEYLGLGAHPSGRGTLILQGSWRAGRLEGTADLSLQQLNWHPSWLEQPLRLHRADSRIHGYWDRNGWQIEAYSLHLGNADFELRARLGLSHSAQDSTHLEMIADLARLNLANLDTYLPRHLPAGLARWLGRKPVRGIAQGRLLWRGRLQDFPFRDHSGTSEVWLKSQQTQIEFHPRWPALAAADLNLKFRNGLVTIAMSRGKLDDAQIETLGATLDLNAPDPVLEIQGSSRNSVPEILKVLTLSPLESAVTMLTEKTHLTGQATLSLSVSLPVRHPEAYQIDGRVKLQGGSWRLLAQPLNLDALRGELHFTQNRLIARLHGRLRHQPARLEATVDRDHTRLTLLTFLDTDALPAEAFHRYFSGTSEALLSLEISHLGKSPPRLSLRSDLQGMAVHLPYPLGKAYDQSQPLQLIAWLQSPQVPVHLDYGPVRAKLTFDRKAQKLSGRIGLNQPPPPANTEGVLILAGHLDRLPLDSWLELWQKQPLSNPGVIDRLQQFDLRTDHLQIGSRDHGPHHFKAYRLDSGWQGTLTTPYTAGDWSWKKGQNRLDFRLDFVDLDGFQQSVPNLGQTQALPERPATDSWPALTLQARRLRWQNRDFGLLDLKAFPELPDRVNFDFNLVGAKHRLEASGIWHLTAPFETQVNGRFSSDDLGEFLKHIGHSTALVQTPTTIDFKLNWPAAPTQFSVAKLGGQAHLKMGPGRWLDAEPGAGRLL
ncbi:MAG: YhdP family protein, partial [Methylohalobius sp.]